MVARPNSWSLGPIRGRSTQFVVGRPNSWSLGIIAQPRSDARGGRFGRRGGGRRRRVRRRDVPRRDGLAPASRASEERGPPRGGLLCDPFPSFSNALTSLRACPTLAHTVGQNLGSRKCIFDFGKIDFRFSKVTSWNLESHFSKNRKCTFGIRDFDLGDRSKPRF